jgi:hypothetical protein
MKSLATILVFPRHTAALLRTAPRWVLPFLLLAAIDTTALFMSRQARIDETLAHLPPHLSQTEQAAVSADLLARLPAQLLIHPFRLFLGWAVFALMLLAVCRAAAPGMTLQWRHLFSLQVHCAAAEVLGTLLVPLLATVLPSDVLFPGAAVAGPLLKSVNISTLWYVGLLIGGVGVLCAARPLKATLLVLLTWGSSLAFHTAVFRLLRDALHLPL